MEMTLLSSLDTTASAEPDICHACDCAIYDPEQRANERTHQESPTKWHEADNNHLEPPTAESASTDSPNSATREAYKQCVEIMQS